MPELDEVDYSREETIEAVRDYYRFLTKMYLEESRIIEPPAGGWPSITTEGFRGMGKTAEVIELLRHLPYIKAADNNSLDQPQGAAFCNFADYRQFNLTGSHTDEDDGGLKICTEGAERHEEVPAHVVGLTYSGHEDHPVFLLDTELGIVHWIDCPDDVAQNFNNSRSFIEQIEDDPYDWAPDNEQEWRANGGTWAIADFFRVLKQQFLKLNFIPLNERTWWMSGLI